MTGGSPSLTPNHHSNPLPSPHPPFSLPPYSQASEDAEEAATSGVPAGGQGFDEVDIEAEAALIKAGRLSDGKVKASAIRNERGCCDCEARKEGTWRYNLKRVMLSACLGHISTGFVVFNLMIMCMPYAGQPPEWELLTESLGEFVTYVFIVEMVLKLLGMGCSAYWADGWNVLDGVIVSLSIVEIIITILLADTGVNISFLRMLRLLRLLRLLKAWPGLYKIVMAFVKAIPQISNLFILMFLLMTIFSLLGMQVHTLPLHMHMPSPCPLLSLPPSLSLVAPSCHISPSPSISFCTIPAPPL